MGVFDLYSKRQKKLRGEVPDVYSYDDIPQPFRVQVVHLWDDALGDQRQYEIGQYKAGTWYKQIVEILRREYGVFQLPGAVLEDYCFEELRDFLLKEKDCERVLDAIELSFRVIDSVTRTYDYLYKDDSSKCADAAIEELNERFKEHGLGYQYASGKIIRIDSELVHSEVVKPALTLLHGAGYTGAEAEFLKAHEHYRRGNAKEAMTECLKSLESTMKVICDKRGWKYDPKTAQSKDLIKVCFDNKLVPPFWECHFSALRTTLESGVPTGRNKLGAHGQGATIVEVPPHLAAYVLHMTASAVVFLVEADRAMP